MGYGCTKTNEAKIAEREVILKEKVLEDKKKETPVIKETRKDKK